MSGSSGDSQLFEETFVITEVDHKKYDRVARLTAESTDKQTKMTLDINTELYPCSEKETLTVVLATTLSLDGQANDVDGKGWRDVSKPGAPGSGESTLADMYDYVCYGKIYKFEDGPDGQTIKVYISFGGLLLSLVGPFKKLTPLRVDYTYLLVKK
ncbi:udp-glucose 4-epimerase gal10 [Ophiostoma piceae UAMH 11346]|uniref:DNA-directed RNA polymerases I, II, and III subunit RPABC3 n=1 Tax=Ophiostoma piceae (strain UAMH 11346) TaxID=1262450 RepID=S3CF97_OPHP1|nr:udp-glucose 4-epimerase gal10 [Ophiostoma piceae UAMH 11346]